MSGFITAQAFLDWLEAGGVVPARTRRVVIDAEAGFAVKMYVEMYGTVAMIEVSPPPVFNGIAVRILGEPKEPDG